MKKLLFLLLLSSTAYGQTCPPVTSLATSSITYNSARVSWTAGAGSIIYQWSLYKMPGRVFAQSGSGVPTFVNISGLLSAQQYRILVTNICVSGTPTNASAPDSISFTTLSNTIVYTPMTAAGYQFKYGKFDSGLAIPRGDTSLGRAPSIPSIVYKNSDNTYYAYHTDCTCWQPLSIDSSGVIALIDGKVDSVTISGNLLNYWRLGVSYGATIPNMATTDLTQVADRVFDGGSYNFAWNNARGWAVNSDDDIVLSTSSGGGVNNQFGVGSTAFMSSAAISTGRASEIEIDPDNITLKPSIVGGLFIDSLTSAAGTKSLRWNPTTGLVSYGDTASTGAPALTQYRLAIGDASNLLSTAPAITANSILRSNANGVPTQATLGSSLELYNGNLQSAGVTNIKNRTGQYYNGGKIVFFGDSYTEGSGATTTAKRWTSIVSSTLGAVEVNYGVAGTTAEKRTPQDYMAPPNAVDDTVNIPYKTPQFKMLVAAWNLNDMGQTAAAYTTANYITDYSLFIQACLNRGWLPNEILIIGSYWIGPAGYAVYATITGNAAPTVSRHEAFLAAAKTVSQNFSTMYLDVYTDQKNAGDTVFIAADHIHPTDAGYARIAADVLQYLGGVSSSATATAIPYANSINFQHVSGIAAEGTVWKSPNAGTYGNTGLADTTFTGDRRLIMSGASYGAFYGLNSANAQTGYGGMEVAMLLSGTDLYVVDNSVFSGSPVATISNTDSICIQRSGSTFTVRSSSDNGLTWSAAIYTYGYTSSAVHYIVTDVGGSAVMGYLNNPTIAYLTGSSYVNIATLKTTPVAFALLPAGVTGMIATVNNSNTNTWGATIAGGGANTVLAFYNGTNWTVIGK